MLSKHKGNWKASFSFEGFSVDINRENPTNNPYYLSRCHLMIFLVHLLLLPHTCVCISKRVVVCGYFRPANKPVLGVSLGIW